MPREYAVTIADINSPAKPVYGGELAEALRDAITADAVGEVLRRTIADIRATAAALRAQRRESLSQALQACTMMELFVILLIGASEEYQNDIA